MSGRTEPVKPILVAPLLSKVEDKLIALLRELSAEEWEIQTVSPRWKVKDVAAHLLDTQLRKLSMVRDSYYPPAGTPIASQAELVSFINRLNEQGVSIYRRLSAPVLISLMEVASRESAAFHGSLDPFAPAAFNVSWAGETSSANWFDTARELTERWHHQEQIRLAVNRFGIMTPELYHPVLDCFMRVLPYTYKNLKADAGTVVRFEVSGDCGGCWFLLRESEAWTLWRERPETSAASITIPQEIAWRLFTKGIDRNAVRSYLIMGGDALLAEHFLNAIAIVG
jgi:uncharacterized protein (TIGR03083 family)